MRYQLGCFAWKVYFRFAWSERDPISHGNKYVDFLCEDKMILG